MHITVCICTYKRPQYLRPLLEALAEQERTELFTFSVVVVDNDRQRSAESVVAEFAAKNSVPVVYCVEERQNIALARNMAVANARGDFVAFIDDDEVPIRAWLLTLLQASLRHNADGALGPVKPSYDATTPSWVIKGGFYDRPSYPTGLVIDWRKGRTGNTLVKRSVFDGESQPFNPAFLSGEDQDFFRRVIAKGHTFVWCHEAMAYEAVPPQRWKPSFMIRRALLRGRVAAREPNTKTADVLKSILAVLLYLCALPFLLVAGFHHFMRYAIKLCDHLGKVLGVFGIEPVKESYVTE